MSDSVTVTDARQGRWIRAALVIFPAGTIILGIASFGFWWVKKVKVEERTYKYALALRRDLSEASLQRHLDILQEVMAQPEAQKLPAVAAYLESSMGAENMGYQVRRDRYRRGEVELANVDVELTGKNRPREIHLLLVPYGDSSRTDAERRAISMLMALAHAMTGEAGTSTLRLAVVPAGHDAESLERLMEVVRSREERLMQVWVAGGVPAPLTEAIHKAFQVSERGTVIHTLSDPGDAAATLAAAQVLKSQMLKAVE